jgi:hypothetical protein
MVYCGIDWHLNTHQFRRTFAVFVSKNIFGDLRYLKYHYNHWNMDMTLLYAKNEEQEAKLFDEILESVHEEKIKIVEHWLDDDALISGGAASSLKAYKRNRKVNTKKDRRQLAENISHTVTIRGTGHGWCMADDYGCGGQGIYEATSCINCKNSIIDRNHKETWLGIWRQQLELRQIKDIGPGGKQRVERDIKRIGCLLQNLGIKVENEEVFCEKK